MASRLATVANRIASDLMKLAAIAGKMEDGRKLSRSDNRLIARFEKFLGAGSASSVKGIVSIADTGLKMVKSLANDHPMEFGGTDGTAYARSEEHTYELQSLMRTPYAAFCLKKKK